MSAIQIDGTKPESIKALQVAIIEIMKVGFSHHHDQETIQKALSILGNGVNGHTTISGCNFTLDKE